MILGHTHPPFYKLIYGFHVPLFFVISGYLFKYRGITCLEIKKWFQRYIIPYFILCGINLLIQLLGMKAGILETAPIRHYILGILWSNGNTQWMPNCSPLWFLTCQFCALILLSIILCHQKNRLKKFILIACVIASGSLSDFNAPKLPWNIDTAMMAVAFMYIGYYLNKITFIKRFTELKRVKQSILMISLVTIGAFAIVINGPVDFDPNRYSILPLMLVGAIATNIFVMVFTYNICNLIGKKNLLTRFIAWLGRHTLLIMGFDYLSGVIASVTLNRVGLVQWYAIFAVKIIILVLGIIIWERLIRLIPSRRIQKLFNF